jgi:hypothetical protein
MLLCGIERWEEEEEDEFAWKNPTMAGEEHERIDGRGQPRDVVCRQRVQVREGPPKGGAG